MRTLLLQSTSLALLIAVLPLQAADPTDNPVATFYSGPEGYPAWTDAFRWSRVINMKTYKKGKTDYEKFLRARDELNEGGGVMYYPAGVYDFTTMPAGVGMMMAPNIVLRGEAPTAQPLATEPKFELATKFVFAFRDRGGGKVPRDWNFIGLQPDDKKNIKNVSQIGICWIHLTGATIAWGPQVDWGKTWGTAKSLLSDNIKGGWAVRDPSGTHPIDALAGGGKKYQGAGSRRMVFGCILEDAAVLDDYSDPGYGPDGFHTSTHCARIIAYGSRIFVANNLLPRSRKNFRYRQKTDSANVPKGGSLLVFDYGKTCGIDINKELLIVARDNGACPGYFEEGIVVRDNFVFNHGHTGFNVAGNWVTITGNRNERALLRQGDDAYGLGPSGTLTRDGWETAKAESDNRSRSFDLAGRNLWIDGNRFQNTGSMPGNDGEGIVCRPASGTHILSWAITRNIHTRGTGSTGGLGGSDADCRGLLIGWNQTAGWVGNSIKRPDVKMTDCAFVANKCNQVEPDEKFCARLGIAAPLTTGVNPPTPPTKATAELYKTDAVKIVWEAGTGNAVGFRVERRIADGKWQVIAYRPPRLQVDPENIQAWVDFTAPTARQLTYRVVSLNAMDDDTGTGKPTEVLTLRRP